jgi:hypothetical protein
VLVGNPELWLFLSLSLVDSVGLFGSFRVTEGPIFFKKIIYVYALV